VDYFTGMGPGERTESMRAMLGVPHPSELALKQAQIGKIGEETKQGWAQLGLGKEQVEVTKEKMQQDLLQFKQTYALEEKKLQLAGRDIELKERDSVLKRFNDSLGITFKAITGLTDKRAVQAELSKFLIQWSNETANPAIPTHSAVYLGSAAIDGMITYANEMVKAGKLGPEQTDALKEQLKAINQVIFNRIQALKDTDPESYKNSMGLWEAATNALNLNIDNLNRGWGEKIWDFISGPGAWIGGLAATGYAGRKLWKKFKGKPVPVQNTPVQTPPTPVATPVKRARSTRVRTPKAKAFGALAFLPAVTGGGIHGMAITPEMREWALQQQMQ